MSQRRDVSAIPASPSLKAKKGPEFEASKNQRSYELGHGNQNSSDLDLEAHHLYFFFFFLDRSTDVF